MTDAEPLKRCSRCREWKPLDAFNRLSRAKDGRQWNCRACNAAWHAEHKAHHNALIAKRNLRVISALRLQIFEYKLARGCADCDERDPTVMEFVHLRDKEALVSALVKNCISWERLLEEIEKCDVVCANCHRRRTARRANDERWRLYLEHKDRVAALSGLDASIPSDIRAMIESRLATLR